MIIVKIFLFLLGLLVLAAVLGWFWLRSLDLPVPASTLLQSSSGRTLIWSYARGENPAAAGLAGLELPTWGGGGGGGDSGSHPTAGGGAERGQVPPSPRPGAAGGGHSTAGLPAAGSSPPRDSTGSGSAGGSPRSAPPAAKATQNPGFVPLLSKVHRSEAVQREADDYMSELEALGAAAEADEQKAAEARARQAARPPTRSTRNSPGIGAPQPATQAASTYAVRLRRHGDAVFLGISLQEDDLTVQSIESEGLFADWNAANPSSAVRVGDRVLEVNGATGALAFDELTSKMELNLLLSRAVPLRVELIKKADSQLGIDLDARESVVQAVSDNGLCAEWNRQNPASAIRVGDRIVEVNGQRSSDDIFKALSAKGKLVIQIVRPGG